MIDFHCHLDLYPDPNEVTQECVNRRIYVLSVTTTPSAWQGTSGLATNAPRIRTGLGLHPQLAHQRRVELDLFERLISETRYVGEVGLDGTNRFKPYWLDQVAVFSRILEVCRAVGGRIMSIHSRRAASSVLDFLESNREAGIPVLHWFSGTSIELERAIRLGCWFSVGPAMLASKKGRNLTGMMPRDRLLTESDGPFARVNGRSALPWDSNRVVVWLARTWDEPVEVVERRIRDNLRNLTDKDIS